MNSACPDDPRDFTSSSRGNPKGANPGKLVTVVLLYQEQESLKEEHSIVSQDDK